jgi:hypothetical protein
MPMGRTNAEDFTPAEVLSPISHKRLGAVASGVRFSAESETRILRISPERRRWATLHAQRDEKFPLGGDSAKD